MDLIDIIVDAIHEEQRLLRGPCDEEEVITSALASPRAMCAAHEYYVTVVAPWLREHSKDPTESKGETK